MKGNHQHCVARQHFKTFWMCAKTATFTTSCSVYIYSNILYIIIYSICKYIKMFFFWFFFFLFYGFAPFFHGTSTEICSSSFNTRRYRWSVVNGLVFRWVFLMILDIFMKPSSIQVESSRTLRCEGRCAASKIQWWSTCSFGRARSTAGNLCTCEIHILKTTSTCFACSHVRKFSASASTPKKEAAK